jgi:transcriptional regulator with XRE-family HTH domain
MNIAQTLKQLREEAGISQNQLARRAEVSVGYISKLESGKYFSLSLDICKQLAQGLHLTLRDFLEKMGLLDDPKTKDVSQLLRTALRSDGLSETNTEKVVEYADLLKHADQRTAQ